MVAGDGRVKVLDFGLAKLLPGAGDRPQHRPHRRAADRGEAGSWARCPTCLPSSWRAGDLNARSDIFSLGVVLHEMATGERPFQGTSSVSLISSIVRDTPPSIDTLRTDLPHHLARIVNRCLEKDPRRRYPSALDVCTELDVLRREVESGRGVLRPRSS